jgi:hypothetical protein
VVQQQPMSYNWGRRRNRLRKGKRGMNSFCQKSSYKSRITYYNKHRRRTPEWGALQSMGWICYCESQEDYEKMRKYAIVIRKFERRLNIAINDFPEIGIFGFEEDFENKEEDEDSKLAVYDTWTRKKIRDAKEDEDEDDDSYYSWYKR